MGEYTTKDEVRFTWNFDKKIQICQNRSPRVYVNIILSLDDLKNILPSYRYSFTQKQIFYDEEKYLVLIDDDNSKITIESSIRDRRRKSFKNPISFSYDDLKKVIKMVETQVGDK